MNSEEGSPGDLDAIMMRNHAAFCQLGYVADGQNNRTMSQITGM